MKKTYIFIVSLAVLLVARQPAFAGIMVDSVSSSAGKGGGSTPERTYTSPEVNDFSSLLDFILWLFEVLSQFAFAAAILAFFYGLARVMTSLDGTEEKKQARALMLWGVVALFVISSIWGLVLLLGQSFNVNNSQSPEQPWFDYSSINP